MYVIDKENNKIDKIQSKTFHELGFKEREHLQEWIAKNPECLDEELLIIQKEFDGFNDTNERLDLSVYSYVIIVFAFFCLNLYDSIGVISYGA